MSKDLERLVERLSGRGTFQSCKVCRCGCHTFMVTSDNELLCSRCEELVGYYSPGGLAK